MPGNFQVICGSMVGENRRSPASTEPHGNLQSVWFLAKFVFMKKFHLLVGFL